MMRLACAILLLSAGRRLFGHRLFGALSAVLLSLGSAQVAAQTMVSADITGDTRWVVSASPYVVSGPLAIQGGATLTIDAGVTVFMAAGASVTVEAGAVRANGTASSPIQVRSDKARLGQPGAPGDWGQWVFRAGTVNTRLEHVEFEHGKGLVVNGSAPEFNNLNIRDHQGVAMAIDLTASPTGVGNRASGNALNGISVPAGDVSGKVRWGLRGIPYVVTAGTVSVGASPRIQSVSPTVVERGQTVTLTVNGSRLAGLSKSDFDRAGLALTPFSGGSDSQLFMQLKVDAAAATGAASLRLQVDAGELVLANAVTITLPVPSVTSIAPASVGAQSGNTAVTVTGRNFIATSEVLFNGATAATAYVSPTELRATLLNQTAASTLQLQVRTPDAAQAGQYILSNAVPLTVQAAVPPTVAIEPAPIALPPDGKAREITLRLSKADHRDHTLNFSISDTSKATVSPASLLIPAGQTSAKLIIVPLVAGTVSLIADSPTLARITAPLFITADFRGANTSYAQPVGVVVTVPPGTVTREVTLANSMVGVAVGAVLTEVSPAAWAVGGERLLMVRGVGIPANAQVSLFPPTGVTLGTPAVSTDGSQLQVSVGTTADAAIGMRRVIVKDASGKELTFAHPGSAVVQLMAGLPRIESIDPVVTLRGTMLKLTVRGSNLQQGSLRITPDTGLRIDTASTVSSDGRTMTTLVDIAGDAPVGDRVVRVQTPAGVSAAEAQPGNILRLVADVRGVVAPVSSLVGVTVGEASVPDTSVRQPASNLIGVLLGAGITDVSPRVGVIGTDVRVTVRGAGLQGVSTVSLLPATGVSVLNAPAVNPAGTELSFTVRIDPAAATGLRRLTLAGANGIPLTTVRPFDTSFLVSAPVPELTSVAPQVLVIGQAPIRMTVRGRNFTNVNAVRFEPNAGVTVSGPFVTDETGNTLAFDVSVAAGSEAGTRAVVVATAAGESGSVQQPGNLVRVAAEAGPTYAGLMSPAVGVQVGHAAPPEAIPGLLGSPVVGLMVGAPAVEEPVAGTAASTQVGVVVGRSAQTMSPSGWLQGASGSITITGAGLDAVTSVSVLPATGLLLDTPVASLGGAQLSVPLSVAPDAPLLLRELRLHTATGLMVFSRADVPRFGIGSLPSFTSVSPIVFEQGKGVVLTLRGSKLQGVTGVSFAPATGIRTVSPIVAGSDGLGEFMTVTVRVDPTAAQGQRVLRLEVPGGLTSAEPTPANTINVVAPQ